MLHVFIKDSEGVIRAHTTDYLPVPKAVIEIVRCRCKTDCASNRSSYKDKYLSCIEMCCCTEQCLNDDSLNAVATYDSDEDLKKIKHSQ